MRESELSSSDSESTDLQPGFRRSVCFFSAEELSGGPQAPLIFSLKNESKRREFTEWFETNS